MFDEYAKIMIQIKHLETKLDEIKPLVLAELKEQEGEKMSHDLGKFSVMKRKAWVYPEEVKEKEVEFKTAKAKAESEGTATYTINEVLMFKLLEL
jgi:hypothetical protein